MSEAGWGTDKPKAAGWYWICTAGGGPSVVRVLQHDDGDGKGARLFVELAEDCLWAVADYDERYEWIGPITPDAYAAGRMVGLQECEQYARGCAYERATILDGWTGSSAMAGVIRGKQSEAERIADWCNEQIEQQAQRGER